MTTSQESITPDLSTQVVCKAVSKLPQSPRRHSESIQELIHL